jgi:hypothetical protein
VVSISTTARLILLVKRYPVVAGGIFALVGLLMTMQSLSSGARYAEFSGGEGVVGRVLSATEDPDRKPRYAAEVTWMAASGGAHRGLVEIDDYLQGRLRPGSELPLILSTTNADAAISAKVLKNHGVLTVAGRSATYLVFPAVLVAAFGILVAVLRNRLVGEPDDALNRRAPSNNQMQRTRPAQGTKPRR